jgi:hypothetical protein
MSASRNVTFVILVAMMLQRLTQSSTARTVVRFSTIKSVMLNTPTKFMVKKILKAFAIFLKYASSVKKSIMWEKNVPARNTVTTVKPENMINMTVILMVGTKLKNTVST